MDERTRRPGRPPARVLGLDTPQSDDLSDTTTVQERIEMVAVLSARMWELTGREPPRYERSEMPIKVVRPS